MSRFFKALEQAERDRAERQGGGPGRGPSPIARVPTPEPPEAPVIEANGLVDEHLVGLLAPTSYAAEQYRELCHQVEALQRTAGLRVIAVSSPGVGDGKTLTAINFAGALAQSANLRVLLAELDLRRPTLARYLGLAGTEVRGLIDAVMSPGLTVAALAQRIEPFGFSVLLAGSPTRSPYEVLKSARVEALLAEAREAYDYVVLDTPPLLSVPDCRAIERWADGFLVVVSAHKTPRKLVDEAVATLPPSSLLGLVFNADDGPMSRYAYGYGHARDHDAAPAGEPGVSPGWKRAVRRLRRWR